MSANFPKLEVVNFNQWTGLFSGREISIKLIAILSTTQSQEDEVYTSLKEKNK